MTIEIKTKVKEVVSGTDRYKNIACVIDDNKKDCDEDKPQKIWIKKYISYNNGERKNVTLTGDTITYKIYFWNDWDDGIYVSLKDFLPKGINIEDSEVVVDLNNNIENWNSEIWWWKVLYNWNELTVDNVLINTYTHIYLWPGSEWVMTIVWKGIKSSWSNRDINRTNFACIYNERGERIACSDAIYTVKEEENKCKKLTIDQDEFGYEWWETRVRCESSNWKAHIKINCGNGKSFDGNDTSSLTKICEYGENETNRDRIYTVTCTVDSNSSNKCTSEVIVNSKTSPSDNFNPETFCGRPENENNPVCMIASPDCFNVNLWNVSIESTEYFPFYFNIEENRNSSYHFKVVGDFGDSYDEIKNKDCERGDVALNSFQCTFLIRAPIENRKVRTKTLPCFTGSNTDYPPLIERWIDMQRGDYGIDVFGDNSDHAYSPAIYRRKINTWDDFYENELGEYKYYLDKIEFLQCADDGEWEEHETTNMPVCQSNFVITEPYTVQKTPSWNLTASTIALEKFKEAGWNRVFSTYINNITTSVYHSNDKVETAMDNFIDKYEKLSVKLNMNSINKFNGTDSETTIKKVPWKNIYFVNWNLTLRWSSSEITRPFTIVQTQWTTTIQWDVKHNMMLLTKGDIIFKDTCKNNQTVKWIFYARGYLKRPSSMKKNDDENNDVWCDRWWLHVKWILIWKGFDALMKSSRSNIKNRFKPWTNKKNEVMDWASVLIEYSPSVFTKSTMPPGAEDFTTALNIYKK